ncbi:DUF1593 domain-containing protein [Flavilitoribacter nigricans]|uniref:DUF1593 domain-containing protein n=1 Tax=Flavilitoribacter nigricans (strain ATCC 23147 / DSM 23189 / NBRC 102662 / NCIMB 1420 / SS-2) TaxID=1122177 RepID=A0A2D0N2J9_FLAN2|nr:DUF1593 domain-containing protein [Flavilitoribacter nigricans]PHN02725.1 hypothetical protein CRP01_30545 [Flavilitoribacter nigricans DSM 23189 = NBRC 102662]
MIACIMFCFYSGRVGAQASPEPVRPRIVVTADPELDDNNSLIRFLLYSSDLNIEGLIYASSQFHWKGDGKGTKWFVPGREYARFGMDICPCESWRWAEDERFIHDAVDAYEAVYPNLKIHEPSYPSPDDLRSKIRFGNIEFDGDISKDSPGSDLIRSLILDDQPGQLFITAWGGQSTIARALKSIQEEYEYTTAWAAIQDKVSRKVVLLPSGDQDNTYATYIKPNWPNIEYRQFRGGPHYGYGAQINAAPENAGFLTPEWMKAHVSDQGPLGDLYRVWGDGKQMVPGDKVDYFGLSGYTSQELKDMGYFVWLPVQAKGSWLGEGDNHTFMNMLGNGLRAYERGTYGGWGGRVVPNRQNANAFSMSNGSSAEEMAASMGAGNGRQDQAERPDPNFFPQAQRDFANRLHWSVTDDYAAANHEPVVTVQGPLQLLAAPGQKIPLFGAASDPDGDELSLRWWQFHTGSYLGEVTISNPDETRAEVSIPEDAVAGQTIHLIFEAADKGEPSLTRYRRVIITVIEN